MADIAAYPVNAVAVKRERGFAKMGNPLEWLKNNIVPTLIVGATVYVSVIGFTNVASLPVQMDSLEKTIDRMSTQLENINEKIEKLEQTDSYILTQIGSYPSNAHPSITGTPPSSMVKKMNYNFNGADNPGQAQATKLSLKSETVIAVNQITGTEYKLSQVADQRILLPYTSGGQEVYFYGQISENGNWDERCILNAYRDNKLELITEAIYDDGKLLSCKQIFYYDFTADGKTQTVWAYSDRVHEEGFSSGATWLYVKKDADNQTKMFGLDDVEVADIITADDFRDKISGQKIAYYHGNTADGYFNDDTGDAYVIHYFPDGTVRYFGTGKFTHGDFTDSTGNAWYIVREDGEDGKKPTDYMCYKGKMKNGMLSNSSNIKRFSTPLDSNDIQEISDIWKENRTSLYIGNSLSWDNIQGIMGDKNFDGDGELKLKLKDQNGLLVNEKE